MKNFLKYSLPKILIIFCVLALDLLTKHLFYGVNQNFIPNLIGFRDCTLNTGGAWSVLSGNVILLAVITAIFVIAAAIFDIFFKNKSKLYTVYFEFILGGAVGNLIDRIFLGGVRDFIFFEFMPNFPTFNVADSFLCIGFVLLVNFVLIDYKSKDKTDNATKDKKIEKTEK